MAAEIEHPALCTLREQILLKHDQVERSFDEVHHQIEQLKRMSHQRLASIYDRFKQMIMSRETELKELKDALFANEEKLRSNALAPLLQQISSELKEQIQLKEEIKYQIPLVTLHCKSYYMRELENYCTIEEFQYTANKEPLWSWGGEANSNNKLSYPQDLTLDNNTQEIFIVDKGNNRILVCSFEGQHLSTIANKQICKPLRIAISIDSVYLTQIDNIIYRFDRKRSQPLQQTELKFSHSGIASYQDLLVYVCEYNNRIIHRYNSDLTIFDVIYLISPFFISNIQDDSTHTESLQVIDNVIWVLFSDCEYPLQCFSNHGEFLRTIISEDKIERAFYFCLDTVGNILVSDYDANRIKVFSSDGEITATIGRDGQVGCGELFHPQGIAVTGRFNIVIIDWKKNHPLQFF
ncbi:hypothetical protein LOD99_15218 [Oopsacas minuta]|uniref:Uncharacterized protein n=1 Tax=Oopsacas minuta TaxID=111878 RepID=A0AAV7KAF8_9METZ|nr:hypothetical protein LOD99_15218 [Oopsacas minuta]